jgi:hypothetical protein
MPGTPTVCDDESECTTDACVSEQGGCVYTNLANGSDCFLSWCVKADCQEGVCFSDLPPDCDDGIPCTVDQCIEGQGCLNEPKQCDDGFPCTSEMCNNATGECDFVPDDSVCDDGIACSTNECVVGEGCVDTFPDGCCEAGLDEGFENGTPTGWNFSGNSGTVKWQVVSNGEAKSGAGALYYGNPSAWNYDSGAANSGNAKSPTFVIPNTPSAKLTFSVWLHIESSTVFDKLFLKLMPDNITLWSKAGVVQQKWVAVEVPMSQYGGKTGHLRWEFNTTDSLYNSTKGVFVDDMKLSACGN